MTEKVCDSTECTFPQTGICMRSYADPEECPSHRTAIVRLFKEDLSVDERQTENESGQIVGNQDVAPSGNPVLVAPEDKLPLPRSGTLGLNEADALMSSRYVNLIGIVGLPDAGKTACLASLYLLLARRMLDGFSYANSQTLMALDEIARGARRWNDGNPPDQMTAHTELTDVRQAGFLHLRLRRDVDGRKFDMLIPDLPGEWSRSLISTADADRFKFLKAAEVLWLMVDGRELVEEKTRQLAIYQISNLIERLASVLPTPRPRTILVASWRDLAKLPDAVIEQVQSYGMAHDFMIEVATIASFSDNDDVRPGIGIAELIAQTLAAPEARPDPWPKSASVRSARAFLNFENNQ